MDGIQFLQISLSPDVFKILARRFNNCSGCWETCLKVDRCKCQAAGKRALNWTDVERWFTERHQGLMSKDASLTDPNKLPGVQEACTLKNVNETSAGALIFVAANTTDW